jgi:RHS repeat-associated core domain
MIYEGGTLKQILVDGGYVTFSGDTPQYHFYIQDHLGNNRVIANAGGTKEQVNHYYPFGGLFGQSTNGDVQRYKYNGKELDRMHGLDWYDYGARHMSPDVGRFTTIDPMAEKYYSVSPYAYCANNPVGYIDEHGDSISITGIIQYGKALNTNILQSVISDWQTISGLTLSISENGNIDYAKDENGKPIISFSQKNGRTIENGSQAARDLLIKNN